MMILLLELYIDDVNFLVKDFVIKFNIFLITNNVSNYTENFMLTYYVCTTQDSRISQGDSARLAKTKDLLLEKLADFEATNRTLRRLLREQHKQEAAALRLSEQRDMLIKKLADTDISNEVSNTSYIQHNKITQTKMFLRFFLQLFNVFSSATFALSRKDFGKYFCSVQELSLFLSFLRSLRILLIP